MLERLKIISLENFRYFDCEVFLKKLIDEKKDEIKPGVISKSHEE